MFPKKSQWMHLMYPICLIFIFSKHCQLHGRQPIWRSSGSMYPIHPRAQYWLLRASTSFCSGRAARPRSNWCPHLKLAVAHPRRAPKVRLVQPISWFVMLLGNEFCIVILTFALFLNYEDSVKDVHLQINKTLEQKGQRVLSCLNPSLQQEGSTPLIY